MFDRVKKIVEHKQKLPIQVAEETKESKRPAKVVFEEEIAKGGVSFNLDELGIKDVSELAFPE